MNKILESLKQIGIVPVVVLEDVKAAKPLGEALVKGNLPCAEVTFRTDAAEEAIQIMSHAYPELLIGAGTVLNVLQVKRAINAGAKFIVSPGFNHEVVSYCIEREIPIVPGVQTPSEIERALTYGLEVVKFFPAEPAGGLVMIKAVAAPYTNLSFMPTGGINADNVKDYLSYDRIWACGGSWMVNKTLLENGEFDKIEELCKEAADIVKVVRGNDKGGKK